MNILHVKYALEVAKHKSISKAARNLYMGQPNLSRAIKELESELGITIFERTSKGINPTPDGEEFLQYAKRILLQIEEVEEIKKNPSRYKGYTSVEELMKDLQKELGLTYVFISHDLSVVKHISDEVGVMYLGSMVEYGSKERIFNNTLLPYTKALFSAVPVPNPHVKMNRVILKGDIPSPVNPPKGCKFHTRCSKWMEICKTVEPKFKDYGNGHCVACHLYPQD